MSDWMIYGANGYTGQLIAKQAAQLGLHPILAGRREGMIAELARQLGLEKRIFSLDQPDAIDRAMAGVKLVLNCAGPFSATSQPMIAACLRQRSHYLDITGEINAFEFAHGKHTAAHAAGIVLCPGVGFDVIPTDCVAAALKSAMPDATELVLGFSSKSRLSPGTAKTSVEGMAHGGKVRKNGQITTVPFAFKTRQIDFGDGDTHAVTIPWGDIATAFYSTGVPNIEVFMSMPPKMISQIRRLNWIRPVLGVGVVQRLLKTLIERRIQGPNEANRKSAPTWVWGEVRNAYGQTKTARIRTANGYQLTIDGSLYVVQQLLAEPSVPGGYYTPSLLLGPALVESLPGSGKLEISDT
ncbi:saccharopine dehydrogenase NADP-binding domain-containing protein [Chitinivorax sp. B]|uniref:saccharopine dehydrogenase family protein n=1 Tax=Chitinivorax sp. B TaxID=2502235 RepID=UPI0010F7C503|nr:saccharopine dehydrogenase NADP-binding domain-containing protein [Chitinivorax sp. B]